MDGGAAACGEQPQVLRTGFHRVEYENGDVYEGEFKEGFRHGQGTYYFAKPTGTRYEGAFEKDHLHGYKGQWVRGVRQGRGRLEDPRGVYEGEFDQNDFHGRGRMAYADDGSVYDGQWFHGKRQGRGKHSLKGEEYEGEFLSDERHGKGKLAINDVGVYTGEFYQGKRHGEGGMVYSVSLQKQLGTAAGEVRKFTGLWKDDMKVEGTREVTYSADKEKVFYVKDALVRREVIVN